MGSPNIGLLRRIISGLGHSEIVFAVRTFAEDGIQYLECVNPDTGALHGFRCVALGGGFPTPGATTAPWDPGRNIFSYPRVLIAHQAEGRSPIALGVVYYPDLYFVDQEPPERDPHNDDAEPPNVQDRVLKNGGTEVIIRENGDLIINASGNVNIQFNGSGGALRVSQNGDATDAAVRAIPATNKLNELLTALSELKIVLRSAAGAAGLAPITGASLLTLLQTLSEPTAAIATELGSTALLVPGLQGGQ